MVFFFFSIKDLKNQFSQRFLTDNTKIHKKSYFASKKLALKKNQYKCILNYYSIL